MIELTSESKEDDDEEKKNNNETKKQTKSCHAVNSGSEFRNWMFFFSLLL